MKDSLAVVLATILLLSLIFSGSSGVTAQASADWQMFRGDLAHHGVGTGSPVLNARLLWNFSAGGQIYSSPAVVDGVVFVGSLNGNIYALKADNGAELWNYSTNGQVYSSPAVADSIVYVGSADGKIYALNATVGARLWSFEHGRRS